MASFTITALCSTGRIPCYPWIRRLRGTQNRPGLFEDQKTPSFMPGIEHVFAVFTLTSYITIPSELSRPKFKVFSMTLFCNVVTQLCEMSETHGDSSRIWHHVYGSLVPAVIQFLNLTMKALQSFGSYVTTNRARRNIPEDLNLQKHRWENRKKKTGRLLSGISYSPVVQNKRTRTNFSMWRPHREKRRR